MDVYSAGTVLYEMVFGKSPFKAKNSGDLLKEIGKGLRQDKDVHVSPELRSLLKDMLNPDPKDRLSMNGVAEFLENYREQ